MGKHDIKPRYFGETEIRFARQLAAHLWERRGTDGDFEVDETLPVMRTGDGEGVWVPARVFIRFDEISPSSKLPATPVAPDSK